MKEINMNVYTVIDEITIRDSKVLVLDKNRKLSLSKELVFSMDGKDYPYRLTHMDHWIVVTSNESFLNKKIQL
jgi:hypothetical protein